MGSWLGFFQLPAAVRRPLWGVLLCLAAGCSHRSALSSRLLAERILPPPNLPSPLAPISSAPQESLPPPKKMETGDGHKPGEMEKAARQIPSGPTNSAPATPSDPVPCQTLTLPDAVDLAYQ